MFDITFAGAMLAGLLSFFTPCILPMVPFYLSYMGGLSVSELREDGAIAAGAQRRLFASSVFFALGVDQLTYVAAAILIVFGLHFLGIIKVPFLYREAKLESSAAPSTVIGAYLMGLAFGFGWTPCVGPALASILMIASGMGDIWRGGLLLLVYGLSMTAPFVIAALFAKPFLAWVQRNRRFMPYVEKAMGIMLIVFAILILTNTVTVIADAMIRWFPWFSTLG